MLERIWILAALILACSVPARAQVDEESRPPRVATPLFELASDIHPTDVPVDFVADGLLGEWAGILPARTFSRTGARQSLAAWVAATTNGLVVVWPESLTANERLHMDFASVAVLDLPETGWLQRFSIAVSYSDEHACAREHPDGSPGYSVLDCEQWYTKQVAYRRKLLDRFIRHIDIDHVGAVRSHEEEEPLLPLHPDTVPVAGTRGDAFEIRVPWNALPAADSLRFDRVYLRAALCPTTEHDSQGTDCRELVLQGLPDDSDTPRPAIARTSENPTFAPLILGSPRHYSITPCGLPLRGDRTAGWGSPERGYFLPGTSLLVNRVMALHQPAMPYQDAPEGMSPTPTLSDYQSAAIGQDEWLCYPPLTWKRGESLATDNTRWHVGEDMDAGRYDILPVDVSNLLIISGPLEHYSRTGAGQCGACPRKALAIWYLNRDAATITPALLIDDIVEGFEDGASIHMAINEDGRHVDYAYRRCQYTPEESSENESGSEVAVRQCTTLNIEWCLEEGAREYTECHRSEESIQEPAAD